MKKVIPNYTKHLFNSKSLILFLFYFSLSFFSFAQAPNGVTVAGGNGEGCTSTQLRSPTQIFIDQNGNLFIGDGTRIQKWANGSTHGTTVAGSCDVFSNILSATDGLFVDSSGDIFVSDGFWHGRVLKWITGATQGITIINNGSPKGLFKDSYSNIFVANGDQIEKWVPNATQGIIVAGGNGQGNGANQLIQPNGVFVDSFGNIFVADSRNHRIQKWTQGATQGITVAGTGISGGASNQLAYPQDVFVDNFGNIFIADLGNHRVQKWAQGATQGITVAGGNGPGNLSNQLNSPRDVFVDGVGNIYVADHANNRIQKFPPINQLPTPTLTVEQCSNQDFCLQLSLSTTAPYTGRRQEFLISTTQDFEGTDAWGYNSTGNLVVNLYNGDSFNKNFQYNTTYYIRARVENIYDGTFSDYVYATYTFTANNIKLNSPISFSGGIPELSTGKTYNLEFGLKNTGTAAWQGDIYWKLSNGTYRLSNSNISIPVGGSGVFTTSYSPTTSEVGNNLPVAI